MDIEQAINGWIDTRKRLEKNWSQPIKLSDIMLKMSTYLSYIGDHLGLLKESTKQSEPRVIWNIYRLANQLVTAKT